MRFLFLLFIVFPAIEIGIFLFLGKLIGILPTVLFMILTGIIGAALQKNKEPKCIIRFSVIFNMAKCREKRLLTVCAFSLAVYC